MEILIITNNSTEAKQWQKLLNKYPNTNAVISNFKNAAAFIEDNGNPDIIFLEANSEEELNFPEKIDCPSPLVVISDDANLCLAAFQLNTFNYHIKPIEEEDFKQSIKKYNKFHPKKELDDDFMGDLQSLVKFVSQKEKTYKKRFMIKLGNTIKSIAVEDIAYFFSQDKVTYLMRNDAKKYPIENTLDETEDLLDPEFFYRANRKYIVSIDAISEIHPYFKGRVKINVAPAQDADIIISSEKSRSFKDWLNK